MCPAELLEIGTIETVVSGVVSSRSALASGPLSPPTRRLVEGGRTPISSARTRFRSAVCRLLPTLWRRDRRCARRNYHRLCVRRRETCSPAAPIVLQYSRAQ